MFATESLSWTSSSLSDFLRGAFPPLRTRKDALNMFILGCVGVFMNQYSFFFALKFVSADIAAVLQVCEFVIG